MLSRRRNTFSIKDDNLRDLIDNTLNLLTDFLAKEVDCSYKNSIWISNHFYTRLRNSQTKYPSAFFLETKFSGEKIKKDIALANERIMQITGINASNQIFSNHGKSTIAIWNVAEIFRNLGTLNALTKLLYHLPIEDDAVITMKNFNGIILREDAEEDLKKTMQPIMRIGSDYQIILTHYEENNIRHTELLTLQNNILDKETITNALKLANNMFCRATKPTPTVKNLENSPNGNLPSMSNVTLGFATLSTKESENLKAEITEENKSELKFKPQ